MTNSIARRDFLKRSSSLALLGTPLGMTLAGMARAAAGSASDYKALVCVYLQGGNDHGNTITPYDNANHQAYQALRPAVALSQSALAATALTASKNTVLNSAGASCTFALAPQLAPLLPLFNAGQLAIQLNVGPLVQPTTRAQYLANPSASSLPYQLMSHQAQTAEWHSDESPAGSTGWGGRFADPYVGGNGAQAALSSMNASTLGAPLMSIGATAACYTCGDTAKIPSINAIANNSLFGSKACASALQSLLTAASSDPFRSTFSSLVSTAIATEATVNAALGSAPTLAANFPNKTNLDLQLQQVARLISVAPGLGLKRQVFFVALGGFDNHDGLTTQHPPLLTQVGNALAGFYASLVSLGLQNQVTSFTLSEFGRAMESNVDGSDHGWGSHHMILGGAVKGAQIYGTAPILANGGPDDIGQGRFIPSTSVDQYAATLGAWFGLSPAQLLTALPNLKNFSKQNLGFV